MPQPKRSSTQKKDAPQTVEGTAQEVGTRENPATGRELVPAPDTPGAIFVALDKADEELVVAEIAGDMIETWAYEFSVGGKPVRGLSFEGVNQAVRVMNARGIGKIEAAKDVPPAFVKTTDGDGNPIWECLVYAQDLLVGGGSWGFADAEIYKSKQNGEVYTDKMAKRIALSKAQRNAKATLIPGPIKVEIITALTGAQIRRIQTPRQSAVAAGERKQVQRARQTKADPPKDVAKANAKQQRMIMARFKEAGLGEDNEQHKRRRDAITAWATGTWKLDQVPAANVDDLVGAIADHEGTLSLILDSAGDANHPDHEKGQIIARDILGITNEDDNGQQQQLTTEA